MCVFNVIGLTGGEIAAIIICTLLAVVIILITIIVITTILFRRNKRLGMYILLNIQKLLSSILP